MSAQPAAVLVLVDAGARHGAVAQTLADALGATGLEVEVSEEARSLCRLAGRRTLVIDRQEPLEPPPAEALTRFLDGGGTALTLGDTLWNCRTLACLGEGIHWTTDDPTPLTELLLKPAPLGTLTDRLSDELRVRSSLRPIEPPPDAEVILTAAWRFTDQVVAFRRSVGRGRLVQVGLDPAGLLANPDGRRLLTRCVREASHRLENRPLGVGLFGYGAIARAHAEAVRAVAGLSLRGVADPAENRRAAAESELGVPTHAEASGLFADPSVDLVVVGTPPSTHTACTLQALDAGKHVVCEKPLALTLADADRMLARADETGRLLTVYQNRRWDPDFVALRELVRSGVLGTVFHLEAFVGGHGHPCSYWHSHEPVSGGTLFDWGSHYVDQILQLLDGELTTVTAHAQKRLWRDVTNADQVRLEMRFADGAEASFMHSDIAAARKPKWYVLGTDAAVVGSWQTPTLSSRGWAGEVVETQLPPADAPARLVVHRPDGGIGAHEETISLPPRDPLGFYRNLADHLLTGEPPAVAPREMRRVIGVLDAATRSIAAGGVPVSVSL